MANINLDLTANSVFERAEGIKTYTFRDLGTDNFKIEENNKHNIINDINTSNYNANAVRASIKNIFSFVPGQEILDPSFGNDIYALLYNPMSDILIENIKSAAKGLLELYEPRIEILSIDVTPDTDNSSYYIKLFYKITALNETDSVGFSMTNSSVSFN